MAYEWSQYRIDTSPDGFGGTYDSIVPLGESGSIPVNENNRHYIAFVKQLKDQGVGIVTAAYDVDGNSTSIPSWVATVASS